MIEQRLRAALAPTALAVRDDSALHAGHAGAREGGGHFHLTIVAAAFTGKKLMERHRMIYTALGDAMRSDIHALSIDARSPEESA